MYIQACTYQAVQMAVYLEMKKWPWPSFSWPLDFSSFLALVLVIIYSRAVPTSQCMPVKQKRVPVS